MRKLTLCAICILGLGPVGVAAAEKVNDFPTHVRADYVFACMAANGQTQEFLYKCSCSIDTIASQMPYEEYVQAETALRMARISGERSALFKETPTLKEVVARLKRAQAEAELKCF